MSKKHIKRQLFNELQKTKKSVLLIGPRQSGKSTLIKKLKPQKIINLADESEFVRIASDPDLFKSIVLGCQNVFVDEVQRIPSLLNTIQVLIDDHQILFYLSGSSARKLKRGQANLLPGRLFTYNISGLAMRELNYEVDFSKALSLGFLPEPYTETDIRSAQKLLESYSTTYLKEEIQAEALTRNLLGFMRFLNVLAEKSGQILDFTKISNQSKVSRTSVVRFIEIIEDTLIGSRLEVFALANEADIIKHPKFYFFDPGVLNGLMNNFIVSKDRIGNLFEHLIYAQLKNSAMALDMNIKITYFRTRNDVEVDFVIEWKNKVYAIEAKAGEVHKSDLTSLKIFRDYYPKVEKCFIVSLKEKKRIIDNIIICSVADLLRELKM